MSQTSRVWDFATSLRVFPGTWRRSAHSRCIGGKAGFPRGILLHVAALLPARPKPIGEYFRRRAIVRGGRGRESWNLNPENPMGPIYTSGPCGALATRGIGLLSDLPRVRTPPLRFCTRKRTREKLTAAKVSIPWERVGFEDAAAILCNCSNVQFFVLPAASEKWRVRGLGSDYACIFADRTYVFARNCVRRVNLFILRSGMVIRC